MIKRYYKRGDVVPFEEDLTHEFKGHTNLCVEEIHPGLWIKGGEKRSRGPISKTLNGFLNTGKGGTAYLGIVDNGTVEGISLTQYQMDHFGAQLDDLMGRYHPPVEEHRYDVQFIPLVEKNPSDEDILNATTFKPSSTVDAEERKRPHLLRTYKYCWCVKDAHGRYSNGILSMDYVIEITIHPWDATDSRNRHPVGQMKAAPIHEDETGRAYIRNHASVVPQSGHEIHNYSVHLVRSKYEPEIQRLKKQLRQLRMGKK